MSGLKVPVFFGSILTLVVVVLQNRTPYKLTLLGLQLRPLSLGVLVAVAVLSGLFLGALLQRIGRRASPSPKPKAFAREGSSSAEFQSFRTMPETTPSEDEETNEFERNESHADEGDSDAFGDDASGHKGWGTGTSSSWTEQAEQNEREGGFWNRPAKAKPRRKRTGFASVTPIHPDRTAQNSANTSGRKNAGDDPAVVDAEYRVVSPYQRETTDEFDDDFFDDFFDEES